MFNRHKPTKYKDMKRQGMKNTHKRLLGVKRQGMKNTYKRLQGVKLTKEPE